MAQQLTAERKAALYAEWLRTGNGREVARMFGVDEKTVRNVLREAEAPRKSALHTHALARAERDARRALEKVRDRLESMIDLAADVKELTAVAAQIHDNARATSSMRVNHAKLSGDLIEKVDHTSGGEKIATVVMLPPLDTANVSTASDSGSVATEPGASD